MDDREKARLARKGMRAAELLEPGAITKKVSSSVSGAAKNAALKGIAAIGGIGAPDSERSPARARAAEAVDVNRALDAMDALEAAHFEDRVRAAAARQTGAAADQRRNLAELRRSFPEPARELAMLIFNCVDLLEDAADDVESGPQVSAAEQSRKEALLLRIAELLEPRAGASLKAFVDHVVAVSRSAGRQP